MPVEYACEDGVAVFTIDNGPLNVCTMAMHEQFYRHFLAFEDDDDAVVGVVTGRGENFCAGDDLEEIRTEAWSLRSPRWDHMLFSARRSKPMVAAQRGYALGAGFLYMMVMTDIRIAGRSLQTGAPEIAYGMGGISGATRLGLQVAPVHAAYVALTGEKIGAERAAEMGLVNEVVDDDDVLDRALEIARKIAAHPPLAVKTELDCLHRGMELSRADAFRYTHHQYWLSRRMQGDDADTGKRALETLKSRKGQ
jgi:enoyl-CoA hydratase/carnithine racemase